MSCVCQCDSYTWKFSLNNDRHTNLDAHMYVCTAAVAQDVLLSILYMYRCSVYVPMVIIRRSNDYKWLVPACNKPRP